MTFRTPAAALSLACLSAATLLLTAADTHAAQSTPFGAYATAQRWDLEYDPYSGTDVIIYQSQTDPDPLTTTVPATSASASINGANTHAAASASLSTGILRASATAASGDVNGVQAHAYATYWETLSFQNASDLGLIQPFSVTVDGDISVVNKDYARAALFCTTGSVTEGVTLQPGTHTYDFFFVVPAGQTTQYFELSLHLEAIRDAALDFSHTVTVSFQPVDGIAYSSASGTFLSAVPEPTSASFLLLAAAPLAARRRC